MKEKDSLLNNFKFFAYRISLAVALGIFLYVFFCAFTNLESMPFFKSALTGVHKGIFLFAVTGIGILLLLCVQKVIEKWEERPIQIVMGCVFAVMLCGQLFFLFHMKINLRYDALKVLDEAISVCKTGSVSATHLDGYFARYTNNYPILFLTVGILKLARGVKLINETYAQAGLVLGSVNILAVDVAAFFSVKLLQKLRGSKEALLGLLMIAGNPIFYIWVPFYYTNTLAMPFIAILLYLFYLISVDVEFSDKKTIVYSFLLGILFLLGVKIRATTLFTALAGGLYLVLRTKKIMQKGSVRLKQIGIRLAAVMLGIVLASSVYQMVERKMIPFDYSDSAFPAIHWINMGAGGTGEYSIVDEQTTMGYASKEEKTRANLEEYKRRIGELGFDGYVKLMFDKLKLTFADAGAGYHSELGVSDLYQDANLYLVGGKSDAVGALMQANYLICLLGCILAIVDFLKKKQSDFYYAIFINILGGFCFHMIWEAGTIYSLSFAMLFPLGVSRGMEKIKNFVEEGERTEQKKIRKAVFIIGSVLLYASVLMTAAGLYHKAVEEMYETNDAVVNQYIYEWGDEDALVDGEVYEQSFYGNRAFNRISFQIRNLVGETNDAKYQIMILKQDGTEVEAFEINASDYGDYDFIRLTCKEMRNETPDRYLLKICKTAGHKDNHLVFLSYRTGNYDAYSYGKLKEYENNRDLSFSVYENKKQPYVSKIVFFIVTILLLLLVAVAQIYLHHCQKASLSQVE